MVAPELSCLSSALSLSSCGGHVGNAHVNLLHLRPELFLFLAEELLLLAKVLLLLAEFLFGSPETCGRGRWWPGRE